jgi:hypothetical protein
MSTIDEEANQDFVTYNSVYYTPTDQKTVLMPEDDLSIRDEGDVVVEVPESEGVFKYEGEVVGADTRDDDEEGKFTAYEIKIKNLLNGHEYFVFRRYSEFSVMHNEVCLLIFKTKT